MRTKQPRIVIVASPPHTGKSSLIARFIGLCRHRGVPAAGILAEGLWDNNQRSGFNLIDLSSGGRVPLAVRCAPHGRARIGFAFLPEGIEAGRTALNPERCADADIIVVDEVGMLEVMGQGWAPYLGALLDLPGKTHIWAVRESLVESVARCWAFTPQAVVDARSPDALKGLIAACVRFEQ